jgi:hypothetical protein
MCDIYLIKLNNIERLFLHNYINILNSNNLVIKILIKLNLNLESIEINYEKLYIEININTKYCNLLLSKIANICKTISFIEIKCKKNKNNNLPNNIKNIKIHSYMMHYLPSSLNTIIINYKIKNLPINKILFIKNFTNKIKFIKSFRNFRIIPSSVKKVVINNLICKVNKKSI